MRKSIILMILMGLNFQTGFIFGNTSHLFFDFNNFFSKKNISSTIIKDTSGLILKIFNSDPQFFKNYIDSTEAFEIQIIYTQIDRDKKNHPHFRQYSYHLNDKAYFCPASTSKLPVSLLALEKLDKISKKGIDKFTRTQFDSAYNCQTKALKDTIAPDSILSIAHYIQKIMLVSDNDAYNRLYEFLGQQSINKRLWKMGFKKTRIIQRFSNCNADCNRCTNPMKFIDSKGKVLYSQPLVKNRKIYKNPLGQVLKGKGYINDDGQFIEQPRDFIFYNNMPLQDLHDIMLRVIFPDAFPKRKRFKINPDDYCFLYKYMGMLPRESEFQKYHNLERFPDNRKKYLMYGTDSFKSITDTAIRIFNIVGQLSGYLTDCSYIVDFKNGVEFVLAATIYNNQSGIFDVSNYRYHTLGFPFLQKLGMCVYKYEISRKREFEPDLSELLHCIKNPDKK